nr:transposase [Psychroflexus torquis]
MVSVVMDIKSQTGNFLHWVHIAISNAKRVLRDIHQSIGSDYLQSYLNEFHYKSNRRSFDLVFEKTVIAAVSCKWKSKV